MGDFFENEKETPKLSQQNEIEKGFEEFWDDVWPSHKRKAGKQDCKKVYTAACLGRHPKADKISPDDLNRATRAYIADTDPKYLKGTLAWLRLPGWEPYLLSKQTFRPWEELSGSAKRLLEQGRCPPSMMEDGKPNDEAAYHLKRFGYMK